MGGFGSPHWQEFRNLCYTAFLHLRRHANLILNLFALMVDASIPDIALEPDKTVKKVQVGSSSETGCISRGFEGLRRMLDYVIGWKKSLISGTLPTEPIRRRSGAVHSATDRCLHFREDGRFCRYCA